MVETLQEMKGVHRDIYAPMTESELGDAERFQPEEFVPAPGTLLISVPPPKEKEGSIDLPQSARKPQTVGRIVAAPDHPDFKPGVWVLFIAGSPLPVRFGGRSDLHLIRYTDDAMSEVLGWFA